MSRAVWIGPLEPVYVERGPRGKWRSLPDELYGAILARQGGGCAICGNPPKSRRLSVDHDHRTGFVRGLLCYRCNRALPSYVTREWLQDADLYLCEAEYRKARGDAMLALTVKP